MTSSAAKQEKLPTNSYRRVLLLCNYYSCVAGATLDHIDRIQKLSKNKVVLYNISGSLSCKVNLADFDVLVIHHSVAIALNSYLDEAARQRIRDFKGYKCAFVQDDYRRNLNQIQNLIP